MDPRPRLPLGPEIHPMNFRVAIARRIGKDRPQIDVPGPTTLHLQPSDPRVRYIHSARLTRGGMSAFESVDALL